MFYSNYFWWNNNVNGTWNTNVQFNAYNMNASVITTQVKKQDIDSKTETLSVSLPDHNLLLPSRSNYYSNFYGHQFLSKVFGFFFFFYSFISYVYTFRQYN